MRVDLGHTFENFKPVPGTTRALTAFKKVLDGPRFMLLCAGGVGNGKTHLCEAAAIELYKRGRFARVFTLAWILKNLRQAIDDPDRHYDDVLEKFCLMDILIIDDIGVGEKSDFGPRILETIVVTRFGRQLLTIMTTNKDIQELPERVLSRLKDQTQSFLVENEGKDYRPIKGKL